MIEVYWTTDYHNYGLSEPFIESITVLSADPGQSYLGRRQLFMFIAFGADLCTHKVVRYDYAPASLPKKSPRSEGSTGTICAVACNCVDRVSHEWVCRTTFERAGSEGPLLASVEVGKTVHGYWS